jgi:hypothetical protein
MAILTQQPNKVKSKQERQQIQQEALSRARDGQTWSNYPAIISGFSARGISVDEIKPRENVFTYNAWKALGRFVRKGEHGVRVVTFRDDVVKDKQDDGTEKTKVKSRPWFATVFHISQTDAMAGKVVA